MMAVARGTLLSVNVGGVRQFDYHGRPAVSAIWKSPVMGTVAARGVNLDGDDQADREAHGGPDKAVYAYAIEDTEWWAQELGRALEYGEFGENLTTEGIDVTNALIGERWEIGNTVLERATELVLPPPHVLDGIGVHRFVRPAVRGTICLIVPFQIHTPGSDTPRDWHLPDRADGRAALELELADATDVHR